MPSGSPGKVSGAVVFLVYHTVWPEREGKSVWPMPGCPHPGCEARKEITGGGDIGKECDTSAPRSPGAQEQKKSVGIQRADLVPDAAVTIPEAERPENRRSSSLDPLPSASPAWTFSGLAMSGGSSRIIAQP